MAEIWKISSDPFDWTQRKAGPIVAIWWTLWILNNISSNISTRLAARAETIVDLQTSTAASMIAGGFAIASAVAAIILIQGVYRRQAALVSGSRDEAGAV